MQEAYETAVNHIAGDNYCTVFTNEQRWKSRVRKLAEQHPGEATITKDNDWGLFATIPASWLKLAPPRKVNMTDERKAELAARLKEARSNG